MSVHFDEESPDAGSFRRTRTPGHHWGRPDGDLLHRHLLPRARSRRAVVAGFNDFGDGKRIRLFG